MQYLLQLELNNELSGSILVPDLIKHGVKQDPYQRTYVPVHLFGVWNRHTSHHKGV